MRTVITILLSCLSLQVFCQIKPSRISRFDKSTTSHVQGILPHSGFFVRVEGDKSGLAAQIRNCLINNDMTIERVAGDADYSLNITYRTDLINTKQILGLWLSIVDAGGNVVLSWEFDRSVFGIIVKSKEVGGYVDYLLKKGIQLEPEKIDESALDKRNVARQDEQNIRVRVGNISAEIEKVAVIGKSGETCDGLENDGQGLAELVEGELLGIYGVVERKHLESILDEQRLALNGLILEDSDFAKAGCLAGAQGTVLASFGCLLGETKIQVKLVDCSTSELYWSAIGIDVSAFELMEKLRGELSN